MKYLIQLSIPCAWALVLAGCAPSPEERLSRAEKAYAVHDYSTARIDLVNIVQSAPENVRALELLARTYIDLSDPVSARATLERLGTLGKLPKDASVLIGNVDLMQQHYDAALAAVAKDGTAEAWRVRALAYLGKGQRDQAARAFASGEKAPGKRGRLLADYANFQLDAGNLGEAARLAELAAREMPRPLNSYLTSGDLLVSRNEPGEALAVFDAALKDYPQSRSALLGKIRVLDALGRTGELRPLVSASLSANPDDLDLIYFDALLDARDGNWKKVRQKLQAHEQGLEQQSSANALYAEAMLELGQAEQARMRLSSQLLREPGNRQVRMLLGETKIRLGDGAGAVETLQPFAQLRGATAQELGLLARAYKDTGNPGAAAMAQKARQAAGAGLLSRLANADKAIRDKDWQAAIRDYEAILRETDGRNVLVLNNLAFAHTQAGDLAMALEFAERALKLAPDNPSVMDTVGWLLHKSGKDRERARTLLREAARKAPNNATIASHLAAVEQG